MRYFLSNLLSRPEVRWPWRALCSAVAALVAVCATFSLPQPLLGVDVLLICVGVVLMLVSGWWVLHRFFSVKNNVFNQWLGVLMCALLVFVCAFVWTNVRWAERTSRVIPDEWNRAVQMLDVRIVSMPTRTDYGWRMLVRPLDEQANRVVNMPEQMSLSWADDDLPAGGIAAVRVGQTWRLPVNARAPHATRNAGVFDQSRYWLENDIEALAYVRVYKNTAPEQLPRLLASGGGALAAIENWRFDTLNKMDAALADAESKEAVGVLKALALGDQAAVSGRQWQLFQDTGVTHLISISGLHVTLLAGILAWLAQRLWRRSAYLTERVPALHVAQWVGLIGALLYALVSGWGLPAQRTVWMLALWLWLSRLGVAHSGLRVLAFSVLWVLFVDPFAVLSVGFWLSYGAVAWLIVAFDSVTVPQQDDADERSKGYLLSRWALGLSGAQLGISLALLPMTLLFFRQTSLFGVWVNFIAIPLVSLLLLPLFVSVGALVLFGWSAPIVWMNQVLLWIVHGLQAIAPLARQYYWAGRIEWWQVLAVFVCSLVLVGAVRTLWHGWGRVSLKRYGGVALCSVLAITGLLLIPPNYPTINEGQLRVTIMDVGQGSAVLLQSAHQNWLYDAGPQYSSDADAGARVLVPHLRYIGVRQIDTLVLSHNDRDHTGGADSIVGVLPVKRIVTSLNEVQLHALGLVDIPHESCISGQKETFDGVTMNVFSPESSTLTDAQASDNQKSCVLRFSVNQTTGNGLNSILLTGDMDMLTEAKMVIDPTPRQYSPDQNALRMYSASGVPLHSDILVMPHHGSDGSSSAPLIAAIQPKIAVAQAGKYNAFKHPRDSVIERYRAAGAQIWRTDEQYARVFVLGSAQND